MKVPFKHLSLKQAQYSFQAELIILNSTLWKRIRCRPLCRIVNRNCHTAIGAAVI